MLFALLDYYRYRSQREIYSTAYIRERNGHLLTRENFPDPTVFKPGSVFFIHRRVSLTSWFIMYVTSSPWNHTGIFTGDGTVVEALTGGTIEHPFSDYLDGRSYMSAYTPPYPSANGPMNVVAKPASLASFKGMVTRPTNVKYALSEQGRTLCGTGRTSRGILHLACGCLPLSPCPGSGPALDRRRRTSSACNTPVWPAGQVAVALAPQP